MTENEEKSGEITDTFLILNQYNDIHDDRLYADPNWISRLIDQVNSYLKKLEMDDFHLLSAKRSQKMSVTETNNFFRSFERHQNNVCILQYMISFYNKFPMDRDIQCDPVNPFCQFKSFVGFNVNLLHETDVVDSIIRISGKGPETGEGKVAYVKWNIKNNHQQLEEIIGQACGADKDGWTRVLVTLQQFCLYWFSLRNKNLSSIRQVDMLIYLMAGVLLRRLKFF